MEVPGYNLFGANHPSNAKRGRVCIYYRNSLPLKILGIHYLQESINFEIMIGGKLYRFVSLYRFFISMILNHLLTILSLNIDAVTASNLSLTVVFGDFNVKSNLWFKGDKTSIEF